MKTTIDIPDSLMMRCKQVIRDQRVTFRGLVEEGLEKVLAERVERKPFVLRDAPARGGGFQDGFDETNWGDLREAIYEGRGG